MKNNKKEEGIDARIVQLHFFIRRKILNSDRLEVDISKSDHSLLLFKKTTHEC